MKKAKILVVEDEIKIANLLKKVIEMDNFVVELAHDGKRGFNMAKNGNFDLIVLDIMLPGLNGLEICRELRAEKIMSPVIMLTAKDTIEDHMAARDAGADDYLSKPFAFEKLIARINGLLAGSVQEQEEDEKDIIEIFVGKENRRKQDSKLAEINKRIMDNIPVSVVTIDKLGNMTSANKYFRNLSKREDYQKTNVFTGKFFVRENLVEDYKKLLSDGTMIKRDHCYERNINGEDKYLKIIAVPLLDKEGNIEGAVSMALDNTESVLYKKKLQLLNNELEKKVKDRTMELNKANAELEKVLDLKSMFIADVSHEMRTALAIIQGNIELMSRGIIEKEEQGVAYGQVFEEIRRVSEMLSDMTLLSESKSSNQKLDYEKIDLNVLISSVCKSLKIVALEKNVKITHKSPKAKIEIIADRGQIEKLLINLVRNAIRYNKENGFIEVLAKNTGSEIIITVRDSGIGIGKEHLSNIFERFYRVDKARSRSDGGSGLGLAICKWVAEIHGGEINVESVLDKGSLFTVKLPINLNKDKVNAC